MQRICVTFSSRSNWWMPVARCQPKAGSLSHRFISSVLFLDFSFHYLLSRLSIYLCLGCDGPFPFLFPTCRRLSISLSIYKSRKSKKRANVQVEKESGWIERILLGDWHQSYPWSCVSQPRRRGRRKTYSVRFIPPFFKDRYLYRPFVTSRQNGRRLSLWKNSVLWNELTSSIGKVSWEDV